MTFDFKNQSIYPCILLDNKLNFAANFYIETFGNGKILMEVAQFTLFEIENQTFKIINTNHPEHRSNPAVSFMVSFETEEELRKIWNRLKVGGLVLMPLELYDSNNMVGWLQDQFGISWQLITSTSQASKHQKISPFIQFGKSNFGRAELASNFYMEVFKNSKRDNILRYEEDISNKLVKHIGLYLNEYLIRMADSFTEQPFEFSPGISFTIECETQKEIDYYWNAFAFGGATNAAGWVKDKFGISWQIIPKDMNKWIVNPSINLKVIAQLRIMTKIDIEKLRSIQ